MLLESSPPVVKPAGGEQAQLCSERFGNSIHLAADTQRTSATLQTLSNLYTGCPLGEKRKTKNRPSISSLHPKRRDLTENGGY